MKQLQDVKGRWARWPALLWVSLALAGCGGGDGDNDTPPPIDPPASSVAISGTVAVGQPVVGASITLACQATGPAAVTSGADGGWTAMVLTNSLPCLVRARGGNVGSAGGPANTADLHAMQPAVGGATAHLNITPLTELMVAAWGGTRPADRFDNPLASQWAGLTTTAVDAAASALRNGLPADLAALLRADNPMTVVFSANGAGHDAVLDGLAARIQTAGSSLSALVDLWAAGQSTPLVPPHLTALSPDTAAADAPVTISGYRLPDAPVVRFGDTAATVTAHDGSSVTATVPAALAAGTALAVTVEGVHGSLSFTPQGSGGGGGVVTGPLSPTNGPVGTVVTLTGSNFPASPSVTFYGEIVIGGTAYPNPVTATVTSASSTQIVVTVPAGAKTGVVKVGSDTVGTFTVDLPRVGAWTQQEVVGGYALASNGARFVKVWAVAGVKQTTTGAIWNDSYFYASNDYMGGQVQWDGTQFVFIVSRDATSSPVQTVAVSPDGLNWTTRIAGQKIISWDPQYASSVRDFSAVDGRMTMVGDKGGIATSTDGGVTWTVEAYPVGYQDHQMLAVDDTGSERVALTWSGDGAAVLRSSAGGAWAVRTTGLDLQPVDLLWTGSTHVAVGRGHAAASGARVLLSTDTQNWRSVSLPGPYGMGSWKAVKVVQHSSGLWLLVHDLPGVTATGSVLLRSTDGGETWVLDTDFGSDPVSAVAFGSSQMMAVGSRTYTRPLP